MVVLFSFVCYHLGEGRRGEKKGKIMKQPLKENNNNKKGLRGVDTFHWGMQTFQVHLMNLDSHRNHRSPMPRVYVTEIKSMDHINNTQQSLTHSHKMSFLRYNLLLVLSKRVQEIKIIILIILLIGNLYYIETRRHSYHCIT